MATIDLGKIKFVFRGTYAGGTAYVPDDVVTFADGTVTSSYICTTATTGNNPSSGGTAHGSWAFLAKGQATSPTTTQGDVIVRGASADARLAIGTAGQALKVNSSANGLEYGTAGGILQVKSTTKTNMFSATSTSSYQDVTGMAVDITPTQTGSKILVQTHVNLSCASSYGGHNLAFARRVSGSDTLIAIGDADGNRTRGSLQVLGGGGSSQEYSIAHSMMHLDTHGQSAGTAITYKLLHHDPSTNNAFKVNANYTDSNDSGYVRTVSNITVFEVSSGVL
tara:strand:+ start:56 stop:895 length:840 start_codon:yes stop_codon:yes gene_type:complete